MKWWPKRQARPLREILRSDDRYVLYENGDGALVLQAHCGHLGHRDLTLSAEQRADYESWGEYYLDVLALKMCRGLL